MLVKTDLTYYAPNFSNLADVDLAKLSIGQQMQLAQSTALPNLYKLLGIGLHKAALTLIYGRINYAYRTECSLPSFEPTNSVLLETLEWFLSEYAVAMPWLGFLYETHSKAAEIGQNIQKFLPSRADVFSPLTQCAEDEDVDDEADEDEDDDSWLDTDIAPADFLPYVTAASQVGPESTLDEWAQTGLMRLVEVHREGFYEMLTKRNVPEKLVKLIAGALISSNYGIFEGENLHLIPKCNQDFLIPLMAQSFEKPVLLWGDLPQFAFEAILLAAKQKQKFVKSCYQDYIQRGFQPNPELHKLITQALRKCSTPT